MQRDNDFNKNGFDFMLKSAIKEDFEIGQEDFPSEEELRKEYIYSAEFEKNFTNILRKALNKSKSKKFFKTFQKVAVVAVFVLPVIFGGLLMVDASRNVIFNMIVEWQSVNTDFSYKPPENESPSSQNSHKQMEGIVYPTYIPEGFQLDKQYQNGDTYFIDYKDSTGVVIRLAQGSISEHRKLSVDSENHTYSEIKINNLTVSLFTAKSDEYQNQLVWQKGNISFYLSSHINEKELIEMAKTMI